MLQTRYAVWGYTYPAQHFLPLAEGPTGGSRPPKGPDAEKAKAQEAADMKKKVTNLPGAGRGLACPGQRRQGRPFPTSPPRPGPSPQLRSGRTGGRLLIPIRISFHPFESAYSTRLPPGIVFHSYCPQRTQVRPWASAMALNFPAPPSCSNCVSKSRLRACLNLPYDTGETGRQDWCSHLRKNCPDSYETGTDFFRS